MKAKQILSMSVVVFLIHLLGACSNEIGNTDLNNNECFMWKKQLERLKTMPSRNIAQKLVLKEYVEDNTISSLTELNQTFDIVFDESSYMAVQDYESGSFALLTIGDLKEMSGSSMESFLEQLRNQLFAHFSTYLNTGCSIKLFDLTWIYEGNEINSIAFATDSNGVLYENIAYFLLDKSEENQTAESSIAEFVNTRSDPNYWVQKSFNKRLNDVLN